MKAIALNPEACFLGVLSFILTLFPVLIPVEGLLLTPLAPFPLLVLAVKYPWRYVLGLAGLEAGALLLLGGPSTLLLFSQYGMVSIIIAAATRRGYSLSQTMVGSVLIPLGIGSLFLAVYGIFTHQPPHVFLMNHLEQTLRTLQEHFQTLEQTHGENREQYAAFAESLPRFVLAIFPAMLVINHLFVNVLNYVLARYYCQRSLSPVCFGSEALTDWRASDYLVWVFLVSGVALLLPFSPVSTIGLNVFLMTLAVYFLQGLAIAVFWGRRLPFPSGVRVLITLMIFLVAGPLCVMLCIAAGLFDLWVDFRRQRHHPLAS